MCCITLQCTTFIFYIPSYKTMYQEFRTGSGFYFWDNVIGNALRSKVGKSRKCSIVICLQQIHYALSLYCNLF